MPIEPRDLVAREVHYCVSSLIYMLSGGDARDHRGDLSELCEQARELSYPLEDWEDAAREAGFLETDSGITEPSDDDPDSWNTWQEACEARDIEPHQREIYEHWIVSDWFADKLAEKGEKIDKDFAGLTVWGRTTTGQAIYMDSVVQDICRDLNERHADPVTP